MKYNLSKVSFIFCYDQFLYSVFNRIETFFLVLVYCIGVKLSDLLDEAAFPFICTFIQRTLYVCLLIRIKLFLMLVFPFMRFSARLFIRAEIHTKGNTNIKNSLIRICDTDKL